MKKKFNNCCFFKILIIKFIILPVLLCTIISCTGNYYTPHDFSKVEKIDSHVHIRSDDGAFETQSAMDNFRLITLNVDHGDSADIGVQQGYAEASAEKYPGRVFFGATFFFDTAGWGTRSWSDKVIEQLHRYISSPGVITVKIWKNIGMTVLDRAGKFIMVDDTGLDPVTEFIKAKGFRSKYMTHGLTTGNILLLMTR